MTISKIKILYAISLFLGWHATGAVVRGDVTLGDDVGIWYNAVLHGNFCSVFSLPRRGGEIIPGKSF